MTLQTLPNFFDEGLVPLFGEFVWHSVTLDPTLSEVSEAHYNEVAELLTRYRDCMSRRPQVMEVASYAHTTGYLLEQRLGVQSTLFDISASNLRMGRRLAQETTGVPTGSTRLIAGDFHRLPFEDGQFDFVFMCSALHHTMRWQEVLKDLIRVVAPGGFLFLQNEPLLREFCFYKFCTNRVERFTPFEKKLDELGIIRTIAQPYLGSRPELMFGMVENQHIPLDALIDILEQDCTIMELTVSPEVCMGAIEREILDRRGAEEAMIARWLIARLETLVAEASRCLGDTERGLGFSLPSLAEITAISEQVTHLLKTLPKPGSLHLDGRLARAKSNLFSVLRKTRSRMPAQLRRRFLNVMEHLGWTSHRMTRTVEKIPRDSFREGLSRLFGAAVKIIVQKKGQPSLKASGGRLTTVFPESDGVILGFDPTLLKLIGQNRDIIPDIQTAAHEKIKKTFPAPEWRFETSSHGIRSVVCAADSAPIHVMFPNSNAMVLLRVHASRIRQPYRLILSSGNRDLASQNVYQTEAFLLAGILEFTPGFPVKDIELRADPLDGFEAAALQVQFALTYAGVFAL